MLKFGSARSYRPTFHHLRHFVIEPCLRHYSLLELYFAVLQIMLRSIPHQLKRWQKVQFWQKGSTRFR